MLILIHKVKLLIWSVRRDLVTLNYQMTRIWVCMDHFVLIIICVPLRCISNIRIRFWLPVNTSALRSILRTIRLPENLASYFGIFIVLGLKVFLLLIAIWIQVIFIFFKFMLFLLNLISRQKSFFDLFSFELLGNLSILFCELWLNFCFAQSRQMTPIIWRFL